MRKRVIIISWIMIGSFILGFIGFMWAYYSDFYKADTDDFFDPDTDPVIYSIEHAAFDSLGQFYFNRDKGGHMNWMITLTQFTSPISMIGGVMMLLIYLQNIVDSVRCRLCKICGGKVIAIYGDVEESKRLTRSSNKKIRDQVVIYRGEEPYFKADEHIIFFCDDKKSLDFFEGKKEKLCENNVYIVFEETDPFLFEKKENDKNDLYSNVHFVNINELLVKQFWRECDLLSYRTDKIFNAKVAIIGFSDLGKKLLHYGLILNCYSQRQRIHYHVWGDTRLFESALPGLNSLINDGEMDDRILFRGEDYTNAIDKLDTMDRIILTDECDSGFVQTVIRNYPDKEIFFVDIEGSPLESFYGDGVSSFASRKSIGVEQIRSEVQHKAGKEINARFDIIYGTRNDTTEDYNQWKEKRWKQIGPFAKESNDLAAEYHIIREKSLSLFFEHNPIKDDDINSLIDELCLLEHIRWCRYHYLNGWKYSSKRDNKKKLHNDLKRFDRLPPYERTKDLEIIAVLLMEESMRNEMGENYLISNERSVLIQKMARKRYRKNAEKIWDDYLSKSIDNDKSDKDQYRIAITGFDIAGIELVSVFHEKAKKRNKSLNFDLWTRDAYMKNVCEMVLPKKQYGINSLTVSDLEPVYEKSNSIHMIHLGGCDEIGNKPEDEKDASETMNSMNDPNLYPADGQTWNRWWSWNVKDKETGVIKTKKTDRLATIED